MGTALGDDAISNGDDAAGIADGGKPVGNDQRCSSNRQIIKGTLDFCFRYRVQSGSGFVQNQNGRILQENSGNAQGL